MVSFRRSSSFIAVTAAIAGTAAWLAFAIHAVVAQRVAWSFFNNWLYNALLVLACLVCLARAARVPAERLAWYAMAAALCSWTAGDLYYAFAFGSSTSVPFPSWADAGYLGFYPFAAVGLMVLVRSRVGRLTQGAWLDGLIAGCATAAAGASVIVQPVLETTDGPTSAVLTNLAYPIGDTLLIALVVCVFAATGWRPGRTWGFIAAGLLVSALADSLYLTQVAADGYEVGSFINALWPAGLLLLAAAAWQPRTTRAAPGPPQALVAPALFAVIAIATGLYDHFARVNAFAAAATAVTFVFLMARAAVAIVENRGLLQQSQMEAVTDALTGLGNRRRLTRDLERAVRAARGPAPSQVLLALFDLDGFKAYNDRFGHPAGDSVLQRLAARLDSLVRHTGGRAYRMGGDEFCVLLPLMVDRETALAQCVATLSETGESFSVTASHGSVAIPEEAASAENVLRLADQRLYVSKNSSRALSAFGEVLTDDAAAETPPGERRVLRSA